MSLVYPTVAELLKAPLTVPFFRAVCVGGGLHGETMPIDSVHPDIFATLVNDAIAQAPASKVYQNSLMTNRKYAITRLVAEPYEQYIAWVYKPSLLDLDFLKFWQAIARAGLSRQEPLRKEVMRARSPGMFRQPDVKVNVPEPEETQTEPAPEPVRPVRRHIIRGDQ